MVWWAHAHLPNEAFCSYKTPKLVGFLMIPMEANCKFRKVRFSGAHFLEDSIPFRFRSFTSLYHLHLLLGEAARDEVLIFQCVGCVCVINLLASL